MHNQIAQSKTHQSSNFKTSLWYFYEELVTRENEYFSAAIEFPSTWKPRFSSCLLLLLFLSPVTLLSCVKQSQCHVITIRSKSQIFQVFTVTRKIHFAKFASNEKKYNRARLRSRASNATRPSQWAIYLRLKCRNVRGTSTPRIWNEEKKNCI